MEPEQPGLFIRFKEADGEEFQSLISNGVVLKHISSFTMGLVLLLFIVLISLLVFLAIIVRPKPTRIPIKSRHVFITGGSSGIGLALAHKAALDGAHVSILARDPTKLQEAKDSIKLSTGRDVAVFSADVRDFEAVDKAVKDAGPIDILVCNQGVFVPQELGEQSLEEIKFMVDVNLMGTFHLIKAALPNMKKRSEKGPRSIAIMSSQAGQWNCLGGLLLMFKYIMQKGINGRMRVVAYGLSEGWLYDSG